ncbi:hypothetical protein JMUB4039_2048 [Leptotrichia trevisanii]|nr:hypothetical protein JMUB4039_2048 [Leptotrichia trevisanii]
MTIRRKLMLINISFITFVLLIIFVFLLYFQYTVYSYILITILILIQVLRLDKKLLMYYYKKYINILDKELDPEKFIEITQNEYNRNKNKRYRNYMKLNLCAGYSSLGKVEEAYQNLKDIDLSKKSLFREQDKILYYYNEALLLQELDRKEEAIVIYKEKILQLKEKFKTNKELEGINPLIEFLNGILFYENDNTKMIEILSELLKKLSNKRQILVIKNLLANYKVKAGETEEARKLYEEVVENGNKLYIVEEAKEKLNKM